MKHLLFSLFAVAVLFTSCGPSAVEFNNAIVKEQAAVQKVMPQFESKMQAAITSGSFDELKTEGVTLLATVDESIANINALKTPSGGEKFKQEAIDAFELVKKIVNMTTTLDMEAIKTNPEAMTKMVTEYTDIAKEAMVKEKTMKEAQAEFAKEHNIQLR